MHTGARQGELLALEWEDEDLNRGLLTFRQTKRTVKASETVRDPAGPTLRRRTGIPGSWTGPIHRDGLTWCFRLAARKAGLQGIRFHDLRHSAASFMVRAGVPLNTVREILGHRSLAISLRYAHLAPEHQGAWRRWIASLVPAK